MSPVIFEKKCALAAQLTYTRMHFLVLDGREEGNFKNENVGNMHAAHNEEKNRCHCRDRTSDTSTEQGFLKNGN
jgi:hypothetical protein